MNHVPRRVKRTGKTWRQSGSNADWFLTSWPRSVSIYKNLSKYTLETESRANLSWNVVWAFVTNFIILYILDNIHFQVGWVFGSISVIALLFTIFFLPETDVSFSLIRANIKEGKKLTMLWDYRTSRSRRLMRSMDL